MSFLIKFQDLIYLEMPEYHILFQEILTSEFSLVPLAEFFAYYKQKRPCIHFIFTYF